MFSNQSPLMGVSRIGLLGKSLMIKTDRLFHIVVICAEWPTKKLVQTIATILSDNFDVKNFLLFYYNMNFQIK